MPEYNPEPPGEPTPIAREEYRVGCFDGSVSDGQATIRHDSMDEPVTIDAEELHDLQNLFTVLIMKDELVRGNPRYDEPHFNSLIRELEA